jgi:nitroreductase
MDALKAIYTRRSIRKYMDDPVDDGLVHEVICAAMMAPSAGNSQPWQFVIVRDRQKLEAIGTGHLYASLAGKAPVAILVCGEPEKEKHEGFWIQDCAAATQNMLLAAHSLGLGAVWLGIYPREERVKSMRSLFGIPDKIEPFALVTLGYADEEKPKENRFDLNRVHYEKWLV